jgi:hypothetical protein
VALRGSATKSADTSVVAASSARNAWAAGSYCDAKCADGNRLASGLLIEHFNGHGWAAVPGPAGLKGGPGIGSIAGTPSDLWATAIGELDQAGGPPITLSYLLHRQDGRWTVRRFAQGTWIGHVQAFSRSDVQATSAPLALATSG